MCLSNCVYKIYYNNLLEKKLLLQEVKKIFFGTKKYISDVSFEP